MNAPIYHKMEIAIWDLFIEYLSSSKTVRSFVKEWVTLKQTEKMGLYAAIILMGGSFGFFLGLAIPQILVYIQ